MKLIARTFKPKKKNPETDPCRILKGVKRDLRLRYTSGWGHGGVMCVLHATVYRITGDPDAREVPREHQELYTQIQKALADGGFVAAKVRSPVTVNDSYGKRATIKMVKYARKEMCKS